MYRYFFFKYIFSVLIILNLILSYMARRLTKDQIISNVYYDLESGFGSVNETLKKAKEQDPTINMVDVKEFMRKQPNKQIHKYRGSNSYTAPFSRYEFQIDIMDMKPLTKEPETKIPIKNDEPRYGLVVIDIFSKLANVVPMKEKSGPITLSAMKESFNKMGFPMSVYSDNDRAFQAGVKDFFEKEGITHVVTLTHANVVERFIRTMKICVYVCICMYMYVYVCICMHMYAYVCICMYMYVYVCICICIYMYLYVCICNGMCM